MPQRVLFTYSHSRRIHTYTEKVERQMNALADHAAVFTCIKGFNTANFDNSMSSILVLTDHSIDFILLCSTKIKPFTISLELSPPKRLNWIIGFMGNT